MKEYIAQLTARQMIEMIANDYVEESHDKMRMQIYDHIRWCKEWLEVNPVIESPLDEVRRKWQERKEIAE